MTGMEICSAMLQPVGSLTRHCPDLEEFGD